jgi:hypothetical protein
VISDSKFFEFREIGKSTKNRPINVLIIGNTSNQLRILIIAGQHGDELGSRQAATALINKLTKSNKFSSICIAILPNANPDGGRRNKRKSSRIDLNRDHLLLSSVENRVIHSFIQTWKPNVIIDLHNYPPSRDYLSKSNHILFHDVLMDGPTNPNSLKGFDNILLDRLIDHVQTDLSKFKYECEKYVLILPNGKVRHSTNDIIDLRNFMSLRFNILTILVEGREPLEGTDYDLQIQRTISAQCLAVLSTIEWITQNKSVLTREQIPYHNIGERYSIRHKYVKSPNPFLMKFLNINSNEIEEVTLPDYYDSLVATRSVRVPNAYGIPIIMEELIDLLHLHGFTSYKVRRTDLFEIQEYLILSYSDILTNGEPKPPKNVKVMRFKDRRKLNNFEIFPIDQEGGHSLLLLIEPQSEYGLSRYDHLGLKVRPGVYFPILRITDDRCKRT